MKAISVWSYCLLIIYIHTYVCMYVNTYYQSNYFCQKFVKIFCSCTSTRTNNNIIFLFSLVLLLFCISHILLYILAVNTQIQRYLLYLCNKKNGYLPHLSLLLAFLTHFSSVLKYFLGETEVHFECSVTTSNTTRNWECGVMHRREWRHFFKIRI